MSAFDWLILIWGLAGPAYVSPFVRNLKNHGVDPCNGKGLFAVVLVAGPLYLTYILARWWLQTVGMLETTNIPSARSPWRPE